MTFEITDNYLQVNETYGLSGQQQQEQKSFAVTNRESSNNNSYHNTAEVIHYCTKYEFKKRRHEDEGGGGICIKVVNLCSEVTSEECYKVIKEHTYTRQDCSKN